MIKELLVVFLNSSQTQQGLNGSQVDTLYGRALPKFRATFELLASYSNWGWEN